MPEIAARSLADFAANTWMNVVPPAARWILQGAGEARAAAARAFGVALTEEPCRARVHGERASLWLAPEEYLLLAPAADAAAVGGALAAALRPIAHSLVDVGHRQVGIEIHGPQAARILNGACPLDFDAAAFPCGACTRTAFAKADIVLWRTRADAFRLEVARSFSAYVAALLAEIAIDYLPCAGAGAQSADRGIASGVAKLPP
ncbi:MAG TPA: sarcosine oxidase subunit gamma family protein [Steroidobacteraceae bacterium]|nr:sarcosine oxidase subunit gamma family protein [Steroidobacteraceae bacterium]